MKKARFRIRLSSFSLIEVLLAISLFSIFATSLVFALIYGEQSVTVSASRQRAVLLAEEGLEGARSIRNEQFSALSDGTYGLSSQNGRWSLIPSSDTTDVFTRVLTISTISESIKKIKSSISWPQTQNNSGNITLETFLSNWMLEQPGGDWTEPTPDPPLPLPDNIPGTKLQTQGNYAFIIRNSPTANFIVVDISSPESPQVKTSLNLPGTPTNIALSDNYAYVSNTDNQQNVQIINISDPQHPTFDPSQSFKGVGNEPATSVAVSGNRLYMTREYKNISNSPTFYAIDISNPIKPVSLGYLRLSDQATGNIISPFDVYVAGNYAYVAGGYEQTSGVASTVPVLQVINISASQPVLKASFTPYDSSQNNFGIATSVSGFGNTVVLGQDSPGNKVYTYDISAPENATLKGSYDATGRVNDITFGSNDRYIYLATEASTQEFQLLDVSNPASPSLVGKTDLSDKLNGVCYSPNKDRVFVVGNQGDGQFIVIKPQ